MQPYHLENQHESFNERLKQAFPFTDADLEANRAGLLSKAQQIHIRQHREEFSFMGWGCGLLCAFLICMVVVGATIAPKTDNSAILLIVGFGLCIIVGGLFIQKPFTQDIQNSKVMIAQGVIKRTFSNPSNAGTTYYIHLQQASLKLSVPYEVYHAFVDEQEYILYYTPTSLTLVAAEHVLK